MPVTHDSGLGPTETTGDTGPTATVPVECEGLVLGAPRAVEVGADPVPFDTRADGLAWFASGDISEGRNPGNTTVVHDLGGALVREDPLGNLWWVDAPDLYRVQPGESPLVFATGLPAFPHLYQDLEVHPHGSSILADVVVGSSDRWVTYVDPQGALHATETSALASPLAVRAVTWSHDWLTLWVGTDDGLWSVPVDADGAPDWSAPTLVSALPGSTMWIEDLAVDACGGVFVSETRGYGRGDLVRFDAPTGTWSRLGGNIDHGYGTAPLRFGRAPGEETRIFTLSGGWSTIRRDWLSWEVGVVAPPW